MLYIIALILAVLWIPGLLTPFMLGGLVHILLAIAVIVLLANVFRDGLRT